MKPKTYSRFKDPELEESWKKAIEAMRKSGTHLYPYKRSK